MGCSSSRTVPMVHEAIQRRSSFVEKNSQAYFSRETRIIQEEEVDVYIDDEYNMVDNDWFNYGDDYQLQVAVEENNWASGENAGGSRNDLELFATNPQYLLSLGPPGKHPDPKRLPYMKKEELTRREDLLDVSVALQQLDHVPPLHAAFFIYRKDLEYDRLGPEYFLLVPPEGDTGAFVNWRQIRHDFKLMPGLYVIVPALFKPGATGRFSLTVRAKPPFRLRQL